MDACPDLPDDWSVTATSEEFDRLEHLQVRYLWEGDDEPQRPAGVGLMAWNYPENHDTWTPKSVGGR